MDQLLLRNELKRVIKRKWMVTISSPVRVDATSNNFSSFSAAKLHSLTWLVNFSKQYIVSSIKFRSLWPGGVFFNNSFWLIALDIEHTCHAEIKTNKNPKN